MAANGKTAKEKTNRIAKTERQTQMLELADQGLRAEELAHVFGVSRRTVDRDFDEVLQSLVSWRTEMGEKVFADHLLALDDKINELHDLMYIHPDSGATQDTIANPAAYDRWFKGMQERAKLLNLYPHTDEHQRSQVTVQQFYLSFDGSNTQARDRQEPGYIEGRSTPMLDTGEEDDDAAD